MQTGKYLMGQTASVQTMLVPGVQTRAEWCVTTLAHSTSPRARLRSTRAVKRFHKIGPLKRAVRKIRGSFNT